jgi:TPR repeat protein
VVQGDAAKSLERFAGGKQWHEAAVEIVKHMGTPSIRDLRAAFLAALLCGCSKQGTGAQVTVHKVDVSCVDPAATSEAGTGTTRTNRGLVETHLVAPKQGRGFLLAIGIDQYRELGMLNAAVADANAVASLMKAAGYDVIKLLTNDRAKKGAILEVLDDFAHQLKPEDRLLFYFAGHGVTKGNPDEPSGYLVPSDTENRIAMVELQNLLGHMPSKQVMFVADACYSGLALESVTNAGGLNRLRYTIVGGMDREATQEAEGHGIFTAQLLSAINGAANFNGDGVVRSHEVFAYVYDAVKQRTSDAQTPQQGLQGQGSYDFELAEGGAAARAECTDGRVWTDDTLTHCCWEGQSWMGGACSGKPICPPVRKPDTADCAPLPPRSDNQGKPQRLVQYELGCEGGNPRACSEKAVLLETGELGVSIDKPEALRLHVQACAQGDGVACARAAQADPTKALQYSQAACDKGDGPGCVKLAALQREQGRGADAATALERGCDAAKDGASCEQLGKLYREGTAGVQFDADKALASYQKACALNDASCAALSELYFGGGLVSRDLATATKLSEKACRAGSSSACLQLSDALQKGEGVQLDADQVAALKVRSCLAGSDKDCKAIDLVKPKGLVPQIEIPPRRNPGRGEIPRRLPGRLVPLRP